MTTAVTLPLPDGRTLDGYLAGPDDGQLLVFHHGSPSSGLLPEELVAAASARRLRLVAWSRPGYGDSTRQPGRRVADVAADLESVLGHLGIARCMTLGWSGGGPHAIASAALLPERVRAAATIGGVAPYPAEGLDWFAGMGAENVEEFQIVLDGNDAEHLRSTEALWETFRRVTGSEIADAFGDLVDDVDRGSLTGAFAEGVAASTREGLRASYWGWYDDDLAFARPWGVDLATVRVPIHVWQGGHDRMVPFGHGRWLAAHMPSAVAHLLPEQGHLSLVVDSIGEILDAMLMEDR
jgi:pimeloyl-ACP methyl ester carboxylesterase